MAIETHTEDYLTVEQVAEELRVHRETVRRWLREGRFRGAVQPGGRHWRIPRSALDSRNLRGQ